ncbi:MAG: FtsX-like permease family protein [Treponema sp.]|nr:FtsX-like permease family protein [Treponema sp.]
MKLSLVPVLNIFGKKGRSLSLLFFSFFLSFSLFTGASILESLKNGIQNLELKLGADIIVVPYEARTKVSASEILNRGNRTWFYFSSSMLNKALQIEGVLLASPQVYCPVPLKSGGERVELIGFDPQTDFSVKPWILDKVKLSDPELNDFEIIYGSDVELDKDGKFNVYGIELNPVARLQKTDTGMDNSIYANISTLNFIIDAAVQQGVKLEREELSGKRISSIMIKVKDGYDVDDVASRLTRKLRHVVSVKTREMTSGISDSLDNFRKMILFLVILVWALCFGIMIVVYSMITGERKKEFAVLRAIGASKKTLSFFVMKEAFLINSAGGILGSITASLSVLHLASLIQTRLNLPLVMPKASFLIMTFVLTVLLSVIFGGLAASFSARRISSQDTGSALREG